MLRVLWFTKDDLCLTAKAVRSDGTETSVKWTYAFGPGLTMFDKTADRWLTSDEWRWDMEGTTR